MSRSNWWDSSRHNGQLVVPKIKLRGAEGIIARCVIGQAERDPFYLDTKLQCDDEDMGFAAYCVPWPANGDPEADAYNAAEKLAPSRSPQLPVFVADDAELGFTGAWDKYGHYKIDPKRLVEYYIRWADEMVRLIPPLTVAIYTALWAWNAKRIMDAGAIDQGEKRYPLWMAHYPFDPRQFAGLPPRYSKDVLDPAKGWPSFNNWRVPKPWTMADVLGIQWTSKGRGMVDGYSHSTFFDRNTMLKLVIPPPSPAPGDGVPDWVPADIRGTADALREQADLMDDLATRVDAL